MDVLFIVASGSHGRLQALTSPNPVPAARGLQISAPVQSSPACPRAARLLIADHQPRLRAKSVPSQGTGMPYAHHYQMGHVHVTQYSLTLRLPCALLYNWFLCCLERPMPLLRTQTPRLLCVLLVRINHLLHFPF